MIGLFKETSIGELLEVYRGVSARPSTDSKLSYLIFIVLGLLVFISAPSKYSNDLLLTLSSQVVDFSLALCAASVGILIAGFSIIASALDFKVFRELSRTPYPNEDSAHSTIVVMFASFVFMIMIFIRLFFACLAFYIFFSKSGVVWNLSISKDGIARISTMLFVASFISYNVFALLSVRTFLWNLYQMLLVVGTAKVLIEESERGQ